MSAMLEVKDLRKAFGGLKVTNGVSFAVHPEEIVAIIGPNGAGKTTLFNEITGKIHPDSGSIVFLERDITKNMPQEIISAGMGRAFQVASIFPDETVLDNVMISVLSKMDQTRHMFRPTISYGQAIDKAEEILESLGLNAKRNAKASELAHGDQKLLDIGIALALEPKLLLLDEPTSGMSPEERQLTRSLITKLWREYRLTLVFIEHDMDTVFGIANNVLVLHQGGLLAQGSPEEVRKNKEVITAYLGEAEE
jgi:branched-chain amino acid transport system ATP-binding protein